MAMATETSKAARSAIWHLHQCRDQRVGPVLDRTFAARPLSFGTLAVECSITAQSTMRLVVGRQVHRGLREEYGEPYGEGDVIGCLLHLPPGGRPFLPTRNVSLST